MQHFQQFLEQNIRNNSIRVKKNKVGSTSHFPKPAITASYCTRIDDISARRDVTFDTTINAFTQLPTKKPQSPSRNTHSRYLRQSDFILDSVASHTYTRAAPSDKAKKIKGEESARQEPHPPKSFSSPRCSRVVAREGRRFARKGPLKKKRGARM